MAGRRSLVDGLKDKPKADHRKAMAFVYGKDLLEEPEKPARKPAGRGDQPKPPAPSRPAPPARTMPELTGRVPLTTRIRHKYAAGLKRASLERQLTGEKPNTVQDILEEALEPWLKERGFLKD
jgi:hypothetical protein